MPVVYRDPELHHARKRALVDHRVVQHAVLRNAVLLLLRTLESQWLVLSGAAAFLMYLTCLAVGTACFRVATFRTLAPNSLPSETIGERTL